MGYNGVVVRTPPHVLIIWWTYWPTNGWDLLASLGHPFKFQRLSCLGSVTARHSSSGCQPNFATLNRGRHPYLAGRPSRWALAHILVCGSSYFLKLMLVFMMQRLSLHKVGHCIVANGKHSLIDMFRYSLREIRNTVLYNRSLTFWRWMLKDISLRSSSVVDKS